MPELPEIEHLRRTLAPDLVGSRVRSVQLHRRDMVRIAGSRKPKRGPRMSDLLEGAVVRAIHRLGKSLAVIADNQRVLALHMGMTGRMSITPTVSVTARMNRPKHTHCEWTLTAADGRPLTMAFVDPRRFGGLWPFESMDDLRERSWSHLGPDALNIDTRTLRDRLVRTKQSMKAALLNQALIAGVGNIYADEALFAAGISPRRKPARLTSDDWSRLAKAIRGVLQRAVKAGGSTIRDYADAAGVAGLFAVEHRVYGRGGLPCLRCGRVLTSATIAQRTTVFCSKCQSS